MQVFGRYILSALHHTLSDNVLFLRLGLEEWLLVRAGVVCRGGYILWHDCSGVGGPENLRCAGASLADTAIREA